MRLRDPFDSTRNPKGQLKMMQTCVSIDIACPIETVFRYTNEKVEDWSLTVIEDQPTNDLRGVGATFRCVTEDHGCRMEFQGEVTAWSEPTQSSIQMIGERFDIEVDYAFQKIGDGTRVTQTSRVQPKGIMKILLFFIGWIMAKQGCDAAEKELQSLKAKLESNL